MKGETLMNMHDLAVTMALFTGAVFLVVGLGIYFFIRFSQRERTRRGSQIAMAHLDPECAELPKREST